MPSETSQELKRRSATIVRRLRKAHPDATCELNWRSPFELLVATILSAQCTDAKVNEVTPGLFERYPHPAALASADVAGLEKLVRPTGFFRRKAEAIREASRMLVEEFEGEVPRTMEELLTLPSVARKSANVVLGTAYGVAAGVVVDTHVMRLSQRMGLTERTQPEKIELDLMEIIPKKDWIVFGHTMTIHGRRVCDAKRPRCVDCPVSDVCPRIGVG